MSDADPAPAELAILGSLIRSLRRTAGLSLRDLTDLTGVSNAYLSQIERGRHEPSLRVLRSIALALGMSLEALLSDAGLLEGERGTTATPDTETAILHDRHLSEPQRFALLSVYRSFVPSRGRHST